MSRNQWDVVLDGNNFRLARGEETPYQRLFEHLSVDEKELFNPLARGTMQSREDFRSFHQSDWSGGQTWFRPMLSNAGSNTYYYGSMFDAFTQPGYLIPTNEAVQTANANIDAAFPIAIGPNGRAYSGTIDTAAFKWNNGTDNMGSLWPTVQVPGSGNEIGPMVYNPNDSKIWGITDDYAGTTGQGIVFSITPDTTYDNSVITGQTFSPGSNIFLFDGEVMFYDGDAVYRRNGGSATLVSDDGLGRDILQDSNFFQARQATTPVMIAAHMQLATATDRGVFYVKNSMTNQGPQARIFRIEVTDAGTYLRRPVGTLPVGIVAVDIIFHMDSLLISCTADYETLSQNNGTTIYPRMQLWHYTQGSIGAVGTFTAPDASAESPWCLLGVDGPSVFIGSNRGVWVYDSIQGGLHPLFELPTPQTPGVVSMAQVINSAGEFLYVFFLKGYYVRLEKLWYTDPRNGTWDDDDFYTLESNWFDFGVPLETKTLRSLVIDFESGHADVDYIVDIKADDESNAWTQVTSQNGAAGGGPIEVDLTGNSITGSRFLYRIKAQFASDQTRIKFRGITIKAVTGEKRERWILTVDGTSITNVEGVPQRPDTVYDNLAATSAKDGIVSFTDKFGKTTADATSAIDVRIDRVILQETTQGESVIQLMLTKVDV